MSKEKFVCMRNVVRFEDFHGFLAKDSDARIYK